MMTRRSPSTGLGIAWPRTSQDLPEQQLGNSSYAALDICNEDWSVTQLLLCNGNVLNSVMKRELFIRLCDRSAKE